MWHVWDIVDAAIRWGEPGSTLTRKINTLWSAFPWLSKIIVGTHVGGKTCKNLFRKARVFGIHCLGDFDYDGSSDVPAPESVIILWDPIPILPNGTSQTLNKSLELEIPPPMDNSPLFSGFWRFSRWFRILAVRKYPPPLWKLKISGVDIREFRKIIGEIMWNPGSHVKFQDFWRFLGIPDILAVRK